jgi:Spy/CpxP family protein refolding chaperone
MSACGQEPQREINEETKARIELYFQKLDLTEEQKPVFEKITLKYLDQMMSLKDDNSKSRYEKYKAIKAIQSNKNKEMKGLLNKEQYTVYKEVQAEMREEFKARAKANR